jgi:hypothetical protein
MVFTFGTEQGPWYNPFQVTEGARVPMKKITIKENGVEKEVLVPVGPDKGFQAVIEADKTGARQKALDIDSAIAFGAAWIFPNYVWKPDMLAKYIPERYRTRNPGIFNKVGYFADKGKVDMVSVAAAYAAKSLEGLGIKLEYTKTFTTLLRTLAGHDLDMLRMRNPLPPEQAKQRYLNIVKSRYESDSELVEAARKQLGLDKNVPKDKVIQEVLKMAADMYEATRLSNIGRLVLGGGR